ncbi:MAG: 23S rRNA (guanosine(2251)-2'-O)-methyltransferase RlmB [Paracoccaceae bacterium]|nr:23S rRNA (guanosine(2251)-2'-O)-methyltransferase RlmB [Paracoccaceae bacterium]
MKKPKWVIEKERAKRAAAAETVWLYGLHAVRDALENPRREKLRLVVTRNALQKLGAAAGCVEAEIADARKFSAPLERDAVHQGAALETRALSWGGIDDCLAAAPQGRLLVVCLDRVTDPHNAGAILRSAEVFGAAAVIAPARHSAPETGVLAKAASGAVERQPYLRVTNLTRAIEDLKARGFRAIGLDGAAETTIAGAVAGTEPIALVLGAEGAGLRDGVRTACDALARIDATGTLRSLNVSNAAAVSLYAVRAAEEC